MKKIILSGVALLLLAACAPDLDDEIKEDEEDVTEEVDEEEEVEESEDNEADKEDETKDNPSNSEEGKGDVTENNPKENNENKEEAKKEDDVVDVAHNVIWAQVDHDYSYLKSVAGDGVTVNEENNTITFDNKEGSHTFDFLTGVTEDSLEFRFVHDEDPDRVIVGFASIDYEKESSYTIEMILYNVDGEWKVVGMDINK